MAAVAITLGCWRNTVIEDIHAGPAGAPSIPDHDMLKLNVEVYRDVREALDLDQINWHHVRMAVTFPFRRLSDGRTLPEVFDPHDWMWVMERLWEPVRQCEEIADQVGTEYFLLACALDADGDGAYWWGQPWFPLVAADFLDRLDDPSSCSGVYLAGHPERRTPPMDRGSLLIGLLEAPDQLPPDARRWLTDLALGYPRTDVIAQYA